MKKFLDNIWALINYIFVAVIAAGVFTKFFFDVDNIYTRIVMGFCMVYEIALMVVVFKHQGLMQTDHEAF